MGKVCRFFRGSVMGLLLSLQLFGCGGGETESSGTAVDETAGVNQALLGPLAGAEIRAYRLTDMTTPIEGPIASNDNIDDLSLAGTFDLSLENIPEDEWILVTATGGWDIDMDDNGEIDVSPVLNKGIVKTLATAASWRSGVRISAISDAIARQFGSEIDLSSATADQIAQALNSKASEWVNDVNEDQVIDYRDVVKFDPSIHGEKSVISWQLMLLNYVAALHQNAYSDELLHRIRLLRTALDQGYGADEEAGAAWIKGGDASSIYRLEIVDADKSGTVDRVIIDQVKSGASVKTVISTNTDGGETVTVDVNFNRETIQFSFVSATNQLGGGCSQSDLQVLSEQLLLSIKPSETYQGMLEIAIPKTLMSSISGTSISMSDNVAGKLHVVEDDPVIGWYFNESDSDENIEYELPGTIDGGVIIVTQEPILYNDGELIFNWRNGTCNQDEAYLGMTDDLVGSQFFPPDAESDHLYKLCVAHLTSELTANTSATATGPFTTVLNYDPETHKVYLPETLAAGVRPIKIASKDPLVSLTAKTSTNNPDGDWSCGFSIGNEDIVGGNFIGDCGYNFSGRVWVEAVTEWPAPEARYNILANEMGIVEDTVTGLQWMRCSLDKVWDGNGCSDSGGTTAWTWQTAQNAAGKLNESGGFGGYTDWRLPTIDELKSIIYCSSGNPDFFKNSDAACEGNYDSPTVAQDVFPSTPATYFWSSTQLAGEPDLVKVVYFGSGFASTSPTGGFNIRKVRLVRQAQ